MVAKNIVDKFNFSVKYKKSAGEIKPTNRGGDGIVKYLETNVSLAVNGGGLIENFLVEELTDFSFVEVF